MSVRNNYDSFWLVIIFFLFKKNKFCGVICRVKVFKLWFIRVEMIFIMFWFKLIIIDFYIGGLKDFR